MHKTFHNNFSYKQTSLHCSYSTVRPNPPEHVNVTEEDNNWIVKWTEPNKSQKHGLYYQVLYYRKQDEVRSLTISVSLFLILIIALELIPINYKRCTNLKVT